MDSAEGCLRRMEAGIGGTPLRLFRTHVRAHRAPWRDSVALSGGHHGSKDKTALLRWPFLHLEWKGAASPGRVGTFSGTAERGLSVRAEYGPHRRALAYPHENRKRSNPRASLAKRMAGDESAGRAVARTEAA